MKKKTKRSNTNLISLFENQVDRSLSKTKNSLSFSDRLKKTQKKNQLQVSVMKCTEDFLMGLPELIRAESAASILGVSIKTIYDWRYRGKMRGVPDGMFVKLNRGLLVRTSVLREWIASQNPSLLREGA